jgi:hypothetical protein
VALFLLSCIVFFISPVNRAESDPMYSIAVSESILKNHTPALNQVSIPGLDIATLSSRDYYGGNYRLSRINGKVLYSYPHGSSILSLPFVALMNAAGISAIRSDGSYDFRGELLIQKTLAAFLMAILAVVFFRTARLMLPISWSLVLTMGSTFGTQIWSTASRALWSHTWEILLSGCVVFLLLRVEEDRARLSGHTLATLVLWMYFVRPTGAITVVGMTIFVFFFYRAKFFAYASAGAAWLAVFFTYSRLTFGEVLPDYYRQGLAFDASNFKALAAILISPSRGLFVFVPAVPLVLYLVARHWQDLPHRRLALLALGIISAQAAMISSWPRWWGGWSYGPRLLTDSVPWFVLLAILGCKALLNYNARPEVRSGRPNYQRFVIAIGLFLIILSIAINSAGALSDQAQLWWNGRQVNIDADPARVWDWRSPQFLADFEHQK